MNLRILLTATLLTILCSAHAQTAAISVPATPAAQDRAATGWHRLGDEGRGVLGTVTAVAGDHFSVKTEKGAHTAVYFSANTRFLKQVIARTAGQGVDCSAELEMARLPGTLEPWKAAGIQRHDVIAASGEGDAAERHVGAVVIVLLDPGCAREAGKLLADYGKSWLAGRVTAVQGYRITLASAIDLGSRTIVVSADTAVEQAGTGNKVDAVRVGDMVRVEGAERHGVFAAKTIRVVVLPRPHGRPDLPRGDAPRQ